jgi:hypothetical protein
MLLKKSYRKGMKEDLFYSQKAYSVKVVEEPIILGVRQINALEPVQAKKLHTSI